MSVATPPRPVALRRETPTPTEPSAPPLAPSPEAPPSEAQPRLCPAPRHDMRCSIGDAASYSVMVGIGETYLAAFALALGTGETFAGLIATLPMLAGASLQLATPWALNRIHSYRTWTMLCAAVQATALLAVPLAVWLKLTSITAAATWLFVAASAYWAASQAAGPAWNTWIEEIIPKRTRANFFACRARISQMCVLIGFAAGGIALYLGHAQGWELAAFAAIFLIGAACRFVSAGFLSQQSEVSAGKYHARPVTLRQIVSQTSGDVGGRFVLYLLAVQAAVQISGPYFTPFMLAQERMSYLSYMALIGICFLGKAIAMPMWGRVAHYSGARRLLWIGGTGIVPIAGLWVFIDFFDGWTRVAYISSIQLLSGIVWAAYELAMLLMFFEAIPQRDRAGVLTLYNFGNAAALVIGSLIGAGVLQTLGESHHSYLVLFALSSLARLFTVPLLWRSPVKAVEVVQPAVRVVAVRPDDGGQEAPILPSLAESK